MAATLTQDRFTGPQWIFERKYDGIRLLAFRHGSDVRLYTRNRLPQNYPPIAEAIAGLPSGDLILDGEVTWRDSFLIYHVFDMPWFQGRDVSQLPLDQRRALLETSGLAALERVAPILIETVRRACSDGWEGVIAKRAIRCMSTDARLTG